MNEEQKLLFIKIAKLDFLNSLEKYETTSKNWIISEIDGSCNLSINFQKVGKPRRSLINHKMEKKMSPRNPFISANVIEKTIANLFSKRVVHNFSRRWFSRSCSGAGCAGCTNG